MNDSGYEVLNVSIIETKLLGPKDDQWAVISLKDQWLAIAKQANPSD